MKRDPIDAFWRRKTLQELTPQEWESLCDGCGKCCLNKVIDDDTDDLYYTEVRCKLLDNKTCQCKQYQNRFDYVPDCVTITPENVAELDWLPNTCAYRRLYFGEDLPNWHYLIAGDKRKMHKKQKSVQGKTVCETGVKELQDHIVIWPLMD
ncbi:YcgN family cysteine cluster protein [Paraferrimonas sedimenticola]|uniref:UPF0260 protein GCM10007895_18080 n=1 Tax=Paraferrimonas sedimenticola TaxID=375674 RepID=A0AA37RXM5_9GAMM|nr:YcgN family cysteine cluster protein [Paraferrimonas sedimenticola]GLP96502.1 UPF0260 protein [Paraferrimonas sedimenticola]